MERVQPSRTRFKALRRLLVEVSATAEQSFLTIEVPEEKVARQLIQFDAGVLLRASNALKAIRLLCEELHWEFAAGTVRQLFELVINMEYLAVQQDRGAGILRYAKFGLLQSIQHERLTLLYGQKTGRSVDTQRLAILEQMLDNAFPEFRRVNEKGKVSWLPSWSGHSARYLAEQSKHPLREDQYDLLFSTWSEQAHGAPAALVDTMFPRGLSADEIIASDDAEVAETVTIAIKLFLELWALLPNVPQVDPVQRREWIRRIVAEAQKYGALSPASTAGNDFAAP